MCVWCVCVVCTLFLENHNSRIINYVLRNCYEQLQNGRYLQRCLYKSLQWGSAEIRRRTFSVVDLCLRMKSASERTT